MITIKQFRDVLEATIDNGLKRSLMVLGPTGVGKSEVIHAVASDKHMQTVDVRLLLWSLTDLKGIPYPDEEKKYTQWLINDVLPREDRDGKSGVLLLEELNAAPKTVQAAAYQLTLDRKIGNYELPDGWFIVATGNREQDNGVYVAPPAPLADRFEIHEVEANFNAWKEYAVAHGCDPTVVAYLSANPTALYTFNAQDSAELIFATPRSWMAVSDLMKAQMKKNVLRMKIMGDIGENEGVKFAEYTKNMEMLPDIKVLLEGGYKGTVIWGKFISTIDVYYLLVQNLIYSISNAFKDEEDSEHKKCWLYIDNSVEFIDSIPNFPLDLKKSYVDQLCEMDTKAKEYIFNGSRNQSISKLMQELDYVKS
jgi:hypothetical protein